MIILKNSGEIDIDVIKTMGVNVKESSDPIGYFGTGLKYAIAVFLREQIELTLYIGENKYEFFSEEKIIRGKAFQLCKMVGRYDSIDLGFTTDLGKNWEVWQAYREIHSNCLDEDGEIFRDDSARGESGHTTFCIQDIETDGIFLSDAEPKLLFSNNKIAIHEGESDVIYYRGIRAKALKEPSMYTYNIKQECQLTEDRLLCYDFQVQHAINESIAQMKDKAIIKNVITADKKYFESTLNMSSNSYVAPNLEFREVYKEVAKEVNPMTRSYVAAHTPPVALNRDDRRAKMFSELADFCRSWGLDHDHLDDDSISLTGDLIPENEE